MDNTGNKAERMTETLVLDGCAIATVDASGTEVDHGHIIVAGNRILEVASGPYVRSGNAENLKVIDGSGMLATPGLINCHHHLYQHLTRCYAPGGTLFEWLTTLYPIWARIDDEMQHAATTAGLASLLVSGCTTTTDHHYLHPRNAGDMIAIEIGAARDLGIRFQPCRGSMDLGKSSGGLPPDEVVEETDGILTATEEAIRKWHDPSGDAMVQISVAPCSPFSVTRRLMIESAELARRHGVRLHTHLAETIEEEAFCREQFGVRPVEYLEDLGWIGSDVWLAHCIHLDEREVKRFGETGTGVAHCPTSNARLGAGIAPVASLLKAGAPVGLGVDGAASNESGMLVQEVREAMMFARLAGGASAMDAREALWLATKGGAKCLGRESQIGSLEAGMVADIALWDLSGLAHAGIADPVCALVYASSVRPHTVIVNGEVRVANGGELVGHDEHQIAKELEIQAKRLA